MLQKYNLDFLLAYKKSFYLSLSLPLSFSLGLSPTLSLFLSASYLSGQSCQGASDNSHHTTHQ